MLGKLIKYDLRYAARSLLIVFSIFIGLALVSLTFVASDIDLSFRIIVAVLALPLSIVLGVMYIVTTVQFYYKSLFGKEGYLTQTLPVRSEMLLLSKILTALIWGAACLAICALYILAITVANVPTDELTDSIRRISAQIHAGDVLSLFAMALCSALESLTCILLCCSIAAIPALKDRNMGIPGGILAYFVIGLLTGQVTSRITVHYYQAVYPFDSGLTSQIVDDARRLLLQFFGTSSLLSLGFAILFFIAAAYLMRKHKAL